MKLSKKGGTMKVLTPEEEMIKWMANRLYATTSDKYKPGLLRMIKYHPEIIIEEIVFDEMNSFIVAYAEEVDSSVSVPDQRDCAQKIVRYLTELFKDELAHIEPPPE